MKTSTLLYFVLAVLLFFLILLPGLFRGEGWLNIYFVTGGFFPNGFFLAAISFLFIGFISIYLPSLLSRPLIIFICGFVLLLIPEVLQLTILDFDFDLNDFDSLFMIIGVLFVFVGVMEIRLKESKLSDYLKIVDQ